MPNIYTDAAYATVFSLRLPLKHTALRHLDTLICHCTAYGHIGAWPPRLIRSCPADERQLNCACLLIRLLDIVTGVFTPQQPLDAYTHTPHYQADVIGH